MKIVADGNMTAVEEVFAPLGDVTTVDGRTLGSAELKDAQVLLVRSVTNVNEALLNDTPVEFVGSATAGLDHVDRDYLRRRDITFANAPGANANSVVEYVLTAIAACDDYLEQVLAGAPVGIVGYGRVGRLLAASIRSLGGKAVAYDPWLSDAEAGESLASLPAVTQCPVIAIHAELSDQLPYPSRHLFDRAVLAELTSEQLLINAARGPVVDNTALLRRMTQPEPPSVVLDVWEFEPEVDAVLFAEVDIGTPHIAGYSYDAKLKGTQMLARALAEFAGKAGNTSTNAGTVPTMPLDSVNTGANLLRELLGAVYDIRADHQALAGVLAQADARQGFDDLRRNYPQRRELSATRVVLPRFNTPQIDMLASLNCQYEVKT